jgi:hypothetical protein
MADRRHLPAAPYPVAGIRWGAARSGPHEHRPKVGATDAPTYLAFFAGPVVGSCDDRWPAIPGCENHGMADSVRHPVQGPLIPSDPM